MMLHFTLTIDPDMDFIIQTPHGPVFDEQVYDISRMTEKEVREVVREFIMSCYIEEQMHRESCIAEFKESLQKFIDILNDPLERTEGEYSTISFGGNRYLELQQIVADKRIVL